MASDKTLTTQTAPWRIDDGFSNLVIDAKGKEICWIEDREDCEEIAALIVEAVNARQN